MENIISEYEQQAIDFLTSTQTEFKAEFLRHGKHFNDEKDSRDIYKITLKRGTRVYSFEFGQSLANGRKFKDRINNRVYFQNGKSEDGRYTYLYPEKFPKTKKDEFGSDFKIIEGTPPTAYDVLTCLQKYDVGTFENFCSEFGYDTDSRKAEKVYKAVVDEYNNLRILFSDSELEQLQEIQ